MAKLCTLQSVYYVVGARGGDDAAESKTLERHCVSRCMELSDSAYLSLQPPHRDIQWRMVTMTTLTQLNSSRPTVCGVTTRPLAN